MRPFDVQLAGGVVMHQGGLAELATGEGKTLTASLPAFLNALEGKGVHVTTVNDYLARRDAEWMGPIYDGLGLTVGVLQQQMGEQDRKAAYQCDITYGTASEFGFDFLRDRLKVAGGQGQRGAVLGAVGQGQRLRTAATTPTCSGRTTSPWWTRPTTSSSTRPARRSSSPGQTRPATPEEQVVYHWADELARQDGRRTSISRFDEKKQKLELTDEGTQPDALLQPAVGGGEQPHAMDKLHEHVEQALHAHYRFRRDQHYMIDKGKIVIIDEFTGRQMPDRHWRDGLHQAVEAKEGVPIHKSSRPRGPDHVPELLPPVQEAGRHDRHGGAEPLGDPARLQDLGGAACRPTGRCIREHWPDRVFPTEDAKFDAVVEEVLRLQAQGRPVLIGTRSVDKSEKLSERLQAGRRRASGAQRPPARAGGEDRGARPARPGRVTIATNMAGRGTDIKPGTGRASRPAACTSWAPNGTRRCASTAS